MVKRDHQQTQHYPYHGTMQAETAAGIGYACVGSHQGAGMAVPMTISSATATGSMGGGVRSAGQLMFHPCHGYQPPIVVGPGDEHNINEAMGHTPQVRIKC